MALILDTGPLLASFALRDVHHTACRRLIEGTTEARVVPAPVIPEVDYFIHTRLTPEVRMAFFQDIQSGFDVVENLVVEDYDRIIELCERYADADIGFVDAAVLAIVERLGETKLATLDRQHFGLVRPRHVAYLTLLP